MIFRRINGRIVPISNDTKKGAAELGAGVGISVGSGALAGKLAKGAQKAAIDADKAYDRSHDLFTWASKRKSMAGVIASDKSWKIGDRLKKIESVAFRSSSKVKKFGVVASGAFVASGVNHLLNNTRLKDSKYKPEVAAASGAATAFAVHSLHFKVGGGLPFGQAAKMAFKAVKKIGRFV